MSSLSFVNSDNIYRQCTSNLIVIPQSADFMVLYIISEFYTTYFSYRVAGSD